MGTALGINKIHSGTDLLADKIWIEDKGLTIADDLIVTGPRIGVDYAGKDAHQPYRFFVQHSSIKLLGF